MKSFELFIESVREIYKTKDYIPLHAPIFIGNEKKYLIDTIDSTLVSSIGSYVEDVEKFINSYSNSNNAVRSEWTCGLQTALICGVRSDDEVITQALTFVATSNSISFNGALRFLLMLTSILWVCLLMHFKNFDENCEKRKAGVFNKITGKREFQLYFPCTHLVSYAG